MARRPEAPRYHGRHARVGADPAPIQALADDWRSRLARARALCDGGYLHRPMMPRG